MTVYYKGFPQSDRNEAIEMVNVDELEDRVRKVIPEATYCYIASGSENEWTWRNNATAFNRFQTVPRSLTNMNSPSTVTQFVGMDLKTPTMIYPVACHDIAHKDAEIATAQGAKAAGALFSSSTYANKSVEDTAAATGDSPKFFQLYLSRDWDFNKMVFDTVKSAGYKGIMLTVDAPASGYREANLKTNFTLPVPLDFFTRYAGAEGESMSVAQMYANSAQKIGPADVVKIKEVSGLPVFVKGIMNVEDAYTAIGAGADGIAVSNHGGREIDTAPTTIDILPEVTVAVNGRVPIILDSGVRRGSHVFKALALDADLVGIGRPFLYGSALGGAKGAESVINQINNKFKILMQLTGCKTVEDVKYADIRQTNYAADNLPLNTDPSVRRAYPVTKENQMEGIQDAATGASKHWKNVIINNSNKLSTQRASHAACKAPFVC